MDNINSFYGIVTYKFVVLPMNIYLTGATSGLGEHLAYEYAKRGAFLALSGRRKEKLESVAIKCEELGAKVVTYCLDVTDQHATKESIEDFLSKTSNIDLVIANAGYGFVDRLHKGDPTELNKVIYTNVIGVINTVVPFMPSMIKNDKGHIAIIGSVASHFAWPGAGAYAASKHAVKALSVSWRKTLPKNVDVTLICPGFVKSEMTDTMGTWTPFMIDTEDGVKRIVRALDKKKKMFIFPFIWKLVIALEKPISYLMSKPFRENHKRNRDKL
tara:strand:+ start:1728 stop:2543 length:816 start_codon:yes stop_codon:yes gene_type:complete